MMATVKTQSTRSIDFSSREEFEELLTGSEVRVDLAKLKESSRYGVPEEWRAEVWLYLLGVKQPEKWYSPPSDQRPTDNGFPSSPFSPGYSSSSSSTDSHEVLKRVRGEVARYVRARGRSFPQESQAQLPESLESIVTRYLSANKSKNVESSLVYMCGVFVYTMKDVRDAAAAFEKMMVMTDEYFRRRDTKTRIAEFHTFCRALLPDLYSHLEDEEVDFADWARSWFQFFLSKELPLECVARLWDTYFSVDEGIELHLFVCLAILKLCKDSLEELETSDVRAHLLRLPALDMDRVVGEAYNLKEELIAKEYISRE
ncbi:RabGAP/TBC [Gonapodya prolifera JEL478]|uniref:RabGAP/TBC n=1 Tax=Gonapodya prolifera (strain JEL478) TaxID=1344416 RepID=A0A139A2K3_GONPJ|nr:RabGAP/TBC [Gonapodya prolifera JEL478]|eukprot:KXS11016.1 RabGAP/TBC [Gonapodya prolifera JEL478]